MIDPERFCSETSKFVMTSSTLSCPYCNAILTNVRPASRRVLCPHCGETFPLSSGMPEDGAPVSSAAQTSVPDIHDEASGRRLSNRTIALSILAFMGLVAILFLGYALQTEQIRREHDHNLPKAQSITIPIGIAVACNVYIVALIFAIFPPKNRPGAVRLTIVLAGLTAMVVTIGLLRVHIRVSSDPNAAEESFVQPIARSVRPAELSGLGYLPEDTNVIAAVNIGMLMETPEGREFLMGNRGQLWNWQRLQEWTGISLSEIDHVIVGLRVDNSLLPRLLVIIETNRAFEMARVKAAVRAGKLPDPNACLFPSDHVLILGLTRKDLERVSLKRSEGIHLPPSFQEALQQRIPRGAEVWAVGHADNWLQTPALAFFAGLPKENREVFQKIQTFAAGIRLEKAPTIDAAFQCADEPDAKALEQLLRQQKLDELKDAKISEKERWVSFQAKVTDLSVLVNRMSINLKPARKDNQ